MDKLIRKLEREGKIRKQAARLVQVEALLKESIKDLDEAKNIAHIATRATYLLAYNAMLKAGRALLFFKGYIPADGGQHKTVVEMEYEAVVWPGKIDLAPDAMYDEIIKYGRWVLE